MEGLILGSELVSAKVAREDYRERDHEAAGEDGV